jgi:hypothetical protein
MRFCNLISNRFFLPSHSGRAHSTYFDVELLLYFSEVIKVVIRLILASFIDVCCEEGCKLVVSLVLYSAGKFTILM